MPELGKTARKLAAFESGIPWGHPSLLAWPSFHWALVTLDAACELRMTGNWRIPGMILRGMAFKALGVFFNRCGVNFRRSVDRRAVHAKIVAIGAPAGGHEKGQQDKSQCPISLHSPRSVFFVFNRLSGRCPRILR